MNKKYHARMENARRTLWATCGETVHGGPSAKEVELALLDTGVAVSKRKANRMAEVACDPKLSAIAKNALMLIGAQSGASFDVAKITPAEIKQATKEIIDTVYMIRLITTPHEGSA